MRERNAEGALSSASRVSCKSNFFRSISRSLSAGFKKSIHSTFCFEDIYIVYNRERGAGSYELVAKSGRGGAGAVLRTAWFAFFRSPLPAPAHSKTPPGGGRKEMTTTSAYMSRRKRM